MTAQGSELLKSMRIDNYKAVRSSGKIDFNPFTVLIGGNGSGKSSLVEALLTYQSIVVDGLSRCFSEGIPFEELSNKHIGGKKRQTMKFDFAARVNNVSFKWNMGIKASELFDDLAIAAEEARWNDENAGKCREYRSVREGMKEDAVLFAQRNESGSGEPMAKNISCLSVSRTHKIQGLRNYIASWNFIMLNPERMRMLTPVTIGQKNITLKNDGSNIAEYLFDIQKQDAQALERILEIMQLAIPYIKDIQPTLTHELKRKVYLSMTEENSKIASWLLSTGTLRFVALLAMLHDPSPPPLIVVDEIENGLDPCSLSILINEIRTATENGITQVIATTHSPYLLDLLDLSDIIMAERNEDNCPEFWRPGDQKELADWAEKFAPGELYRMDRLKRG